MISIITTTYNTDPDVLARTWASIKSQTYKNWEWVVWDDSTKSDTWAQIYGFASDERYKIVMHKSHVHSGSIGQVKRKAFMSAEGDILLELDHDDELTSDCLEHLDATFKDKEVGFAFSNWAEINENGESCRYPEGWAFGYGSDYWDDVNNLWVMRAPEVNETTMRHIVSMPNHLRAWRASTYRRLNGHRPELQVADDYDLVVRTLLTTKYAHIDQMLYKQHINYSTAQRTKNDLIQSLVSEIAEKYKEDINEMWGITN